MDRAEFSNRTWLCTVVFLDMVEYSKHSVTQQMALKRRFNSRLGEAIAHVAVSDRIVLDTGDGAALCFMGAPEEALMVSLRLLHGFRDEAKSDLLPMQVRIGIHVGPVKIMKDLNGQLNTIGDGINAAQRVMSFAQPNQILVSRSFYEVVACLSQEYAQLFQYLGAHTDKHVREHILYEVIASQERKTPEESRLYEASLMQVRDSTCNTAGVVPPILTAPVWDTALLERVGKALGGYLGPVARVLVKQAAQRAANTQMLCEMLATHLTQDHEREPFLRQVATLWETPAASSSPHTVDAKSRAEDPASASVDARLTAPALPTWDPQLLQTAQALLAQYVGPMAKILVQRAAARTTSADALYRSLAEHLATAQEKSRFLRESGIPV